MKSIRFAGLKRETEFEAMTSNTSIVASMQRCDEKGQGRVTVGQLRDPAPEFPSSFQSSCEGLPLHPLDAHLPAYNVSQLESPMLVIRSLDGNFAGRRFLRFGDRQMKHTVFEICFNF